MRARRFPPLLVWLSIVTLSVVVLGGSFAYASRVGERTAREDAERRAQRLAPSVTGLPTTGNRNGNSPDEDNTFEAVPPRGGQPGGPGGGGGNTTFNGLDMSSTAPPIECLDPLVTLAALDPLPADSIEDVWGDAADCASTKGAITIPSLTAISADPLTRQCLGAYFIRATLAYRMPAVVAPGLDRFLRTCVDAGLTPGSASQMPTRVPRPPGPGGPGPQAPTGTAPAAG